MKKTSQRKAGSIFSLLTSNEIDVKELSSLVEQGADVNALNEAGDTPLHVLCKVAEPNYAVIANLLEQGADPNKTDKEGHTPLYRVIERKDFHSYARKEHIMDILIEHGADVHSEERCMNSCLHTVFSQRHPKMTEYFINKIDKIDSFGISLFLDYRECITLDNFKILFDKADDITKANLSFLLRNSVNKGSVEIVKFLIEQGANVNIVKADDYNGRQTCLHSAVKATDIEITKILLEANADPNIADSDKKTPIMSVTSAEITKLLIKYGADVNTRDNKHSNVLMNLKQSMELSEILKILLSENIDISTVNQEGTSPLKYAISEHFPYWYINTLRLLQNIPIPIDALVEYLSYDYEHSLDFVKKLIDGGADIDFTKRNEANAFILSAKTGKIDITEYLLEKYKFTIDGTDNEGNTALHYAKNSDMVKYLLSKGLSVKDLNNEKNTPLIEASLENYGEDNIESMKELILQGSKINHKNKNGYTALHYFCGKIFRHLGNDRSNEKQYNEKLQKNLDFLRFLLDSGADPNIKGEHDSLPIFLFNGVTGNTKKGRKEASEIIKILIDAGLNLNSINDKKQNLIQWAVDKQLPDIIQHLVYKGMDINLANGEYEPLLFDIQYKLRKTLKDNYRHEYEYYIDLLKMVLELGISPELHKDAIKKIKEDETLPSDKKDEILEIYEEARINKELVKLSKIDNDFSMSI